MKDFKGNQLRIGDKVIFTDSYCRLLEGKIVGIHGRMLHITPLINRFGHTKSVHSWAVMKHPDSTHEKTL